MIQIKDFDAVIFDMDGVLIDSEPLWKIAMEDVFHSLGSTLTKSDFQKTVGLRIDEVVHFWNIQENWCVEDEQEIEEAIIVKMIELISQNAAPLAGVIETLEYLKSISIKIGLGTSSSNRLIQVVLNELNIHSYFDVTHSAEHEDFGKPHPAVYLHVAKELGVKPHKCLVIEDSFNGVLAGLAAKMKVVCIPEKTHHPNPKLSVADFHFESMVDFLHEIAQ
ncbi:MAG: hexitol phosphatase HxpB [Crocinitomicaceae bacterium]